jgi:general secretion pathway protein G
MSRRSGFTLIELVVVILILGILAGVAAPKMFSTSAKATDAGMKQSLNIIRDAIELYVSQSGGTYPPCTDPAGADFKLALTPYLRGQFPKSLVGTKDAVVKGVGGVPVSDNSSGWMYSTTLGTFIANSDANTLDASVKYNAL